MALLHCFSAIIYSNIHLAYALASIDRHYCFESDGSFIQYLLLYEEGLKSSTDIGHILPIGGNGAALRLLNQSILLSRGACMVWAISSTPFQPYKGFYWPKLSYLPKIPA